METNRIRGIHLSEQNKKMKIFEKSGFAKESFRAGCGEIIQYREYKNGKVSKDIDWSHIHKGIPRGTVHIHNMEWQ